MTGVLFPFFDPEIVETNLILFTLLTRNRSKIGGKEKGGGEKTKEKGGDEGGKERRKRGKSK